MTTSSFAQRDGLSKNVLEQFVLLSSEAYTLEIITEKILEKESSATPKDENKVAKLTEELRFIRNYQSRLSAVIRERLSELNDPVASKLLVAATAVLPMESAGALVIPWIAIGALVVVGSGATVFVLHESFKHLLPMFTAADLDLHTQFSNYLASTIAYVSFFNDICWQGYTECMRKKPSSHECIACMTMCAMEGDWYCN